MARLGSWDWLTNSLAYQCNASISPENSFLPKRLISSIKTHEKPLKFHWSDRFGSSFHRRNPFTRMSRKSFRVLTEFSAKFRFQFHSIVRVGASWCGSHSSNSFEIQFQWFEKKTKSWQSPTRKSFLMLHLLISQDYLIQNLNYSLQNNDQDWKLSHFSLNIHRWQSILRHCEKKWN